MAADPSDLTTLAAVKAWLGIGASTADDVVLQTLITAASNYLTSVMSLNILSATYNITRDGPGGYALSVKDYPITAVASVTVDGVAIPVSSGPGVVGYRFTEDQIILEGYRFCRGHGNVSATYTAGNATAPVELAQAVVEMVGLAFKEKDRIGHVSKVLAGETVTFTTKDVPPRVQVMINQNQRVVPI